jgi:hypothetical protein
MAKEKTEKKGRSVELKDGVKKTAPWPRKKSASKNNELSIRGVVSAPRCWDCKAKLWVDCDTGMQTCRNRSVSDSFNIMPFSYFCRIHRKCTS